MLLFVQSLLGDMAKRSEFRVKEFYPNIMSFCSNTIRKENLSLKAFEIVLNIIRILLQANYCFINSV
jgi:hypothetical protein